jgi:hypothetical protein
MNTQQEMIEQSMQAQRSYLDIVRSRHHQWAYSAEDPEIQHRHLEIANLIQQTLDQYYELLTTYQSVNSSQIRSDIFTLYPISIPTSNDA